MQIIPELLKLPIKIIVALCIASGIIILVPNDIVELLYMRIFREEYGFIIGITFIISLSITGSYVLFYVLPKLWERINRKKNAEKLKKGQIRFLKSLNKNELQVIRELLNEPDNTLDLPMNRGIIKKLEYHLVISKAGSNFMVDLTDPIVPYFLQPWVFEFFDKNGNLKIEEEKEGKEV